MVAEEPPKLAAAQPGMAGGVGRAGVGLAEHPYRGQDARVGAGGIAEPADGRVGEGSAASGRGCGGAPRGFETLRNRRIPHIRWVSVSPTFGPATCRRAGVAALEFDGEHDALLQSLDGTAAMSYIKQHGTFHDIPARFLAHEMPRLYPFARNHGISRFLAGNSAQPQV